MIDCYFQDKNYFSFLIQIYSTCMLLFLFSTLKMENSVFSEEFDEVDSPLQASESQVQKEWTDEEILKLIGCVEVLPLLWNASDENYRNKNATQSAWRNMSELEFDSKFSDGELQAKWTNARIQYRSYVTKSRKSKSDQGVQDGIKWKFFEAMEFVGNAEQVQDSSTLSNLETDESTSETNAGISTPIPVKRRRLTASGTADKQSTAAAIVTEGMKHAVAQLKDRLLIKNSAAPNIQIKTAVSSSNSEIIDTKN